MEIYKHVAVVTGAADGIGLATARRFADAGYAVAVCDLDGDKARFRARELGKRHIPVTMDVTSETDVARMVAEVLARFGTITALVNNAGIGPDHQPTIDQTLGHFQDVLHVHLDGMFLVSREVGRVMLNQGGGTIVSMSSFAGLQGLPRRNAYAAAKAGIVMMTKDLACEWAYAGIRVNAVAPGIVYTDLVKKLEQAGKLDLARLRCRIPMSRAGRPEEIADAVFFLSSPQSSYITGTVLSVDGGWVAFGDAGPASEVN